MLAPVRNFQLSNLKTFKQASSAIFALFDSSVRQEFDLLEIVQNIGMRGVDNTRMSWKTENADSPRLFQ